MLYLIAFICGVFKNSRLVMLILLKNFIGINYINKRCYNGVADQKSARGIVNMRKNVFLILMFALPLLVCSVFATIAGPYYIVNKSREEVPDTTSVLVYSVDYEFGEFNRTYAKGRGIVPKDKTVQVTFDKIPEIASWDGVKDIYVRDIQVDFDDFSDRVHDGEAVKVAVPVDTVVHFGEITGMASAYAMDYSEDIPLYNGEYAVFRCSEKRNGRLIENVAEQLCEEPDCCLYYKYDPETWEEFYSKIERYIFETDMSEDVEMLITTASADAAKDIQIRLVEEFPASNYESAEFAAVWNEQYNKDIRNKIIIAGVITGVILIGVEVLFAFLRKPRKQAA